MAEPLPALLADPAAASQTTDEDALAYASAIVREYCGWHIAPSLTEARVLDSDGSAVLLLPTMHMTDLGSVEAAQVALLGVQWSANGILYWPARFPAGLRMVSATFTHGWDAAPASVQAVVAAVARRMPRAGQAVSSEGAGGVTRAYVTPSGAFTATEAMVLDRYRLPSSA